MIKLLEKQNIILSYYRDGKSQRQISRETNISRKTIRKYLREYEQKKKKLMKPGKKVEDTEELIADIVEKPKYDTSSRFKVKLTEKVIKKIKYYLAQNDKKRAEGCPKQQMKKIDIYEALTEKGYDIGYTTVCNAVRRIQKEKNEAFIRQEYGPADSAEFDWGEVKLKIAGKNRTVHMSVFTTAYGDYRYGDLYYSHKRENFSDSHASFFEEVGGVYKEIVYDNERVMVRKFVKRSKKEPTEALAKLSLYYGFSFRFCNNYQAHEKGHVERSVEYLRRKIFSKKDTFSCLDEARAYFRDGLKKLNRKPQKRRDYKSAYDILAEEKKYLLALPPRYDTARVSELRVDKYSTVTVDSCRYSVPDSLVGKIVFTKIYPYKVISYHEGKKVSSHKRKHGYNQWSINISHYLATLRIKPGALKRSVALSQVKPALRQIYIKL